MTNLIAVVVGATNVPELEEEEADALVVAVLVQPYSAVEVDHDWDVHSVRLSNLERRGERLLSVYRHGASGPQGKVVF